MLFASTISEFLLWVGGGGGVFCDESDFGNMSENNEYGFRNILYR